MALTATTVKKPSENSPIKRASRRRCERKQTPQNRVRATKGKSWEKTVEDARLLWAQLAIAILVMLGPLFIPWLLFEPMAFLFWGWFRSLIVFSLYGALAGAVLRVFMGVTLGYVTTYSNAVINFDLVTMGGWVLIILPLFVAGILASLKVGELASMLVTGSAVTSSGITGAAAAAASGGATAAGGAAAAGRGVAAGGI